MPSSHAMLLPPALVSEIQNSILPWCLVHSGGTLHVHNYFPDSRHIKTVTTLSGFIVEKREGTAVAVDMSRRLHTMTTVHYIDWLCTRGFEQDLWEIRRVLWERVLPGIPYQGPVATTAPSDYASTAPPVKPKRKLII